MAEVRVCRLKMFTGMTRDVMWVMILKMVMMIVPAMPEKREFRGSREGVEK